jgi:raffinose/stachyose/melibiose transport system permease protein
MHTKEKTSVVVAKLVVAIIIAVYVLFPFFLVVINSCKPTDKIAVDPIGFDGVSISQLFQNLSDVINNTHFLFWQAFGYSVLITVLSLALLAVLGGMAAWVICRNNRKAWSTVIYFVFIASMIIPFQVVMLPLVSTFRDVGKFIGIPMLQSVPGIVCIPWIRWSYDSIHL